MARVAILAGLTGERPGLLVHDNPPCFCKLPSAHVNRSVRKHGANGSEPQRFVDAPRLLPNRADSISNLVNNPSSSMNLLRSRQLVFLQAHEAISPKNGSFLRNGIAPASVVSVPGWMKKNQIGVANETSQDFSHASSRDGNRSSFVFGEFCACAGN